MRGKKIWWHPITVKPSELIRNGKILLLISIILETLFLLLFLGQEREELYRYERMGVFVKEALMKAKPYSQLALSSFHIYVFCFLLGGLALLPCLFFYQHYIGSKSIYTMLRIREKKIHIRFYIENIIISVVSIWGMIVLHIILYCFGYLLYLMFIPSLYLPEGGFLAIFGNRIFTNVFPVLRPYLWIVPICIGILLPSITHLFALAERSKRRGIIGAMVGSFGLFSLYSCYTGLVGYPFYLIIATVATVGTGIYYLNFVEIV